MHRGCYDCYLCISFFHRWLRSLMVSWRSWVSSLLWWLSRRSRDISFRLVRNWLWLCTSLEKLWKGKTNTQPLINKSILTHHISLSRTHTHTHTHTHSHTHPPTHIHTHTHTHTYTHTTHTHTHTHTHTYTHTHSLTHSPSTLQTQQSSQPDPLWCSTP